MFRSRGERFLSLGERVVLRLMSILRRRLIVRVRLDDRGHPTNYLCETAMDAQRPLSLWIKESGTMAWIEAEVRPTDVFIDIGANIGIYTIAAAMRMQPGGQVYAFEPHKVNGQSLLRNIEANGLASLVSLFSIALSDREGLLDFNYASLASASTASQLGHSRIPGSSEEFRPVATEKVYSTSVDDLVAKGSLRPPNLVKIDVDGNEIAILRGMSNLLRGPHRPRAVQVELNVGEQEQIVDLMLDNGYQLSARHHTHAGKAAEASGLQLDRIAHNALFRPVG